MNTKKSLGALLIDRHYEPKTQLSKHIHALGDPTRKR